MAGRLQHNELSDSGEQQRRSRCGGPITNILETTLNVASSSIVTHISVMLRPAHAALCALRIKHGQRSHLLVILIIVTKFLHGTASKIQPML